MEFDEEEPRRDDAFYDELERAYIAELEHVRAGGVDLTKAILREEVYERLIGELEREDVSSDARDAVASFLQDLRRDGVEWHSIGHGRGYFEADDERRVFPEYAAPCTRATRIPGSVCMKFAHEHGAPWDQWTCEYAAGFGNLQSLQYAHEHGCPWDKDECIDAALAYGNTACLTYMRTLKDAVESKLDDAMSALDEIARDIPEGAYVTICAALKLSHDEHKKRKR